MTRHMDNLPLDATVATCAPPTVGCHLVMYGEHVHGSDMLSPSPHNVFRFIHSTKYPKKNTKFMTFVA